MFNSIPPLRCLAILLTLGSFPGFGQSELQLIPNALQFIVMGDWGRNGADHQKEVAIQMGKTANTADVEFIIATGDNFYPSGVISEHDPLWYYSFENIYTDHALQRDWYPVLGNHDYESNPEAQLKYASISRRWRMPGFYYSKKFNLNDDPSNKLLIVFIDTSPFIRNYYSEADHPVHKQDTIAQKAWIEKTLAESDPAIKWRIVVGHHPMYTGGGRTENHDTRNIRNSFEKLFEKYHVNAYLTGHEHSLQHLIGQSGTLHHFISGAASERTPARKLVNSRFAVSDYGFMLFSVTKDYFFVQVINANGKILYTTKVLP